MSELSFSEGFWKLSAQFAFKFATKLGSNNSA